MAKKMPPRRRAGRRKPRKRRSKATLDKSYAIALTLVIFALCGVFLALTFVFSDRGAESEIAAGENTSASESAVPVEAAEGEADTSPAPVEQDEAPKPSPVPAEPEAEEAGGGEVTSVVPLERVAPPVAPSPKYDIPEAVAGAKLVFVIDDGGYSTENLRRYTSLPFPIAVAVLPRLPHSKECAEIVRVSGKEIMLHQPMQAQNLSLSPGDGAILPDMNTREVYQTVVENIEEIGPVAGMNNHEGSLITSDGIKMGAVMDAVYDEGIYFLDSRTTAQTRAPAAALERGIEILERDIFIDDEAERSSMLTQILRGLDVANRKNHAIMIGHVDKSAKILPDLLIDMYPYLTEKGYTFAFPSELLSGQINFQTEAL